MRVRVQTDKSSHEKGLVSNFLRDAHAAMAAMEAKESEYFDVIVYNIFMEPDL